MLSRLFKRPPANAPFGCNLTFEQAKDHFEAQLSSVNTALREQGSGPLIALPLCATACDEGPIADFLLQIGANPFERWNMMYFAADATTARLLDTVQYTPDLEDKFDQDVTDVIGRVAIAWDSFHERFPKATDPERAAFAAQLCGLLDGMARDLEPRIYPEHENKWAAFFAPADTST